MRSEGALLRRAALRWAPWALYALAALATLPLFASTAGVTSAPAEIEVRRVTVSCPRTAQRLRVAEVLVAPGDAVTAGQLLARMDSSEMDAELDEARLKLRELELAVTSVEVRSGADRLRAADRLAYRAEQAAAALARLSAEQQQGRSELAQIDAWLAQEQALVADRVADLDRLNALKLRGAGLAARLGELERGVKQARRAARDSGARLAGWRGAAAGAPSPVEGEVAPARAAAAAQRERVRLLEAARRRLDLEAPFDGRVEDVLLQPGETATNESAVVTVVDDRSTTRAVAFVAERFAARIRVGDRARLVPRDGSGPALHGRVRALAPSIAALPLRFATNPDQPVHGRRAYIELDAPAALPGQAFDASFLAPEEARR